MTRFYQQSTRRRREEIKAVLFAGLLVFIVAGCLTVSVASAGPMIIGSEMNANGTLEYLCLGTGCENLRPMDW